MPTHIRNCKKLKIDCPLGCGRQFLKNSLNRHFLTCPEAYKECNNCFKLLKHKEIKNQTTFNNSNSNNKIKNL